jgi:hypothetical protein
MKLRLTIVLLSILFLLLLGVALRGLTHSRGTPVPPDHPRPGGATTAHTPLAPVAITPPAPPVLVSTQANFTFFLCGDSRGGDDVYLQILAAANAAPAAFLLSTGDLVPLSAAKHWAHFAQLMTNCHVSFFPDAGNHDVGGDHAKSFVQWTPTHQAHYSFDFGQLHFAMANDSLGMSAEELAWLDADLSASRQPVKIVVHHLPAWNPRGPLYGMYENQEAFLGILQKHAVRYDFCGHDHGYQTGITNGTTLIISGGAGAPLYHPANQGGFNHYVEFTVAGTNLSFRPVPIQHHTKRESPANP